MYKEAVVDKAKDLVRLNKIDNATAVLVDALMPKNKRYSYLNEEGMLLLAKIFVDTDNSQQFKECIHQYKKNNVNNNPKSVEDVVKCYIDLSQKRTEEIQATENDLKSLGDLECEVNYDWISLINSEGYQQINNRMGPSLKFLWESFRICVDLLKGNTVFEKLYHEVTSQATDFCRKYRRIHEFRKLSEMVRFNKHRLQMLTDEEDMLPETWVYNHETLIKQLDLAMDFQMFDVSMKLIEDLFALIEDSKVQVKPRVIAYYYQKLAILTQMSGCSNLIHAACLHMLFFYSKEKKKTMSASELEHLATQMVLATLAVPIVTNKSNADLLLESGELTNPAKLKYLSDLLKLPQVPTRSSLANDIFTNRVHHLVNPELRHLFETMELDYKPLTMGKEVLPVIECIEQSPIYSCYTESLKTSVITKVLVQVSKAYKSIKISEFAKLCPFMNEFKVLQDVMVIIKNKISISITIDMYRNMIEFDESGDMGINQIPHEEIGIRNREIFGNLTNQLSTFGSSLASFCNFIGLKNEEREANDLWIRQSYINTINASHEAIMKRKDIIENRKEEIERELEANKNQISEQIRLAEQKQREVEEKRLIQERAIQEQRRLQLEKELREKKILELRKNFLVGDDAGKELLNKFTEKELAELDRIELAKKHREEKQRIRTEEDRKLIGLEQSVDYFVRESCMEQISLVKKKLSEETFLKYQKMFEDYQVKKLENDRKVHELAVANSQLCKKYSESINSEMKIYIDQIESEKKAHQAECDKICQEYREKRRADFREEMFNKQAEELAEKSRKEAEEKKKLQESKPAKYVPAFKARIQQKENLPVETQSTKYVPPSLTKESTKVASENKGKYIPPALRKKMAAEAATANTTNAPTNNNNTKGWKK